MIYNIAKQMNDKLIETRRSLHKIPETGFEEFQTSEFIKNDFRICAIINNMSKSEDFNYGQSRRKKKS